MILDQLSKPAIFAHRGSSAHAPENTLAAFELAIRHGADAIELDAKLSADGHVVVIHDQTVDRTTDGTGKVRELTLAQLSELDAGSYFDIAFRREPIPTLEQVFQAVGYGILINVELTNYASPTDPLPEKVAGLVRKFGLEKRVLFSSFNPLALVRIRRILPEVPVGLLALPGLDGAWARSWSVSASRIGRCQAFFGETRAAKWTENFRLYREPGRGDAAFIQLECRWDFYR